MTRILTILLFCLAAMPPAGAADRLVIRTSAGEITIEFWAKTAANTAAQFKKLAKEGAYNGAAFDRIVKGFIAEADVAPGREVPAVKAEPGDKPFVRGVLGLAHESGKPDSGRGRFFICLADARFLDKQYTAFAHVVAGMEVLDRLAETPVDFGPKGEKSKPVVRVEIKSIEAVPAEPAAPSAGKSQ